MNDKKTAKLFNNTILFFIGSIGSKFIQFFLVPLYTYTLTQAEYGVCDLVITTINFLIPIFSIQIADGFLRYGLDKNQSLDEIINCVIKILAYGSILSCFLIPLSMVSNILKEWIFFLVLILNVRMYRDVFAILLKIEDKNKLYAIDSMLYTFILCFSSVILLSVFKLGIYGYFISYVIANIVSLIFIFINSKLSVKHFWKYKNKAVMKKMILYSLPLVINSVAYWITTGSDKFMIMYYLNNEELGLYAIATKIPTIMTTFISVFSQAWLLSSINEYEEDRDKKFYYKTFYNFSSISFIFCVGLILIIKYFMKIYVSDNFYTAWIYVPILIFSAIFSGFSSFYNGIFYAYKKNVTTTIITTIGAIINVVLNIILIPIIGIMGATIATAISWFIIAEIKKKQMVKLLGKDVNDFPYYKTIFLIIIEIIVLIIDIKVISMVINIFITLIVLFLNRKIVEDIIVFLKQKILNIKNKCKEEDRV